METNKNNEAETILRWFVHDSNNSLVHIKTLIENFLIHGNKAELIQAQMHVAECLHMNTLLGTKKGEILSAGDNLKLWSNWKKYPDVNVVVKEDYKFFKFAQVRYFIAIMHELSKNAWKADGTLVTVEVDGKVVTVSNNGKRIEFPERIFEKGFSTFQTSGEGLGIISKLCKFGSFNFELTSAEVPVTFKITLP